MTHLMTTTGRNILEKMSPAYTAAKDAVPRPASALIELCRFAAPYKYFKRWKKYSCFFFNFPAKLKAGANASQKTRANVEPVSNPGRNA